MSHHDPLRRAWKEQVLADDLDAHMAGIGQAEANADLVLEFVRQELAGATLLFAGAGTGQMFDFVSPLALSPYTVTFTDLNQGYLERLRARLIGADLLHYGTFVDDIEESALESSFDLAIAVLVLEHVDWRRAVATLARLSHGRVLVVHQENPEEMRSAITPSRPLVGSMADLAAASPHLVSGEEIVREFQKNGFELRSTSAREVMDGKRMVGLSFERTG